MIERPSRLDVTSPVWARRVRFAERVLGNISRRRAISPAAKPTGPTFTRSRNMARRASCAKADKVETAAFNSIFLEYTK
jgi:hypothetical protein